MQLSFYNVLRAEFLKTKRSFGLTIALTGPLLITSLLVFFIMKNAADFSGSESNPWNNFARLHFQFYFLLYPLFAALIGFLLTNLEHKSRGFKHLFTLPAPKFHFYFSKVLILMFWLLSSLIFAAALIYVGGNLIAWAFPDIGYQNFSIVEPLAVFFVKMFMVLLSIMAIHFFLSIYFDNFIISVGSACFLVIFGLVVHSAGWEYSYLLPYSYGYIIFLDFFTEKATVVFSREMYLSVLYAVVFFSAGYVLMSRKEIR